MSFENWVNMEEVEREPLRKKYKIIPYPLTEEMLEKCRAPVPAHATEFDSLLEFKFPCCNAPIVTYDDDIFPCILDCPVCGKFYEAYYKEVS